jgi:hypothetical protein
MQIHLRGRLNEGGREAIMFVQQGFGFLCARLIDARTKKPRETATMPVFQRTERAPTRIGKVTGISSSTWRTLRWISSR